MSSSLRRSWNPWRPQSPSPVASFEPVLRLVERLNGLAAVVGPDGVVLASNEALAGRLEGQGGPRPATLPAELRALLEEMKREARKTGKAAERPFLWATRGEAWLLSLCALEEAGSYLLQAHEVTRAAAAEARLAMLEEEVDLMRDILDRVPDQIYAKDADHRFVVANRAVTRKILGRSDAGSVVGRTDHDFFPKADADAYRADEARLVASGRDIIDLEEKALYQGEETWNLTSKMLRRGKDGRVLGIVGINRDVTARRRAELALEEEQALLSSLMNSIPDIIFFKDRAHRFTAINAAYARMLGLGHPREAVGRTVGDFFGAAHFEKSRGEEDAILTRGQELVGQEERIEFPGGHRWLLVSRVPRKDAAGAIIGLVGVARDITDRKDAEERLQRSLEDFLQVAQAVSEGDLTQRGREAADTPGRIAAEVNQILDRIGTMLAQVRRLADAVSTSAAEIRIATNQIARGAQQQSEETLATSASAEEMARSMSQVAQGAQDAARAANQARETAHQGDHLAREASEAMGRIEVAVAGSMERMRAHEAASEEVQDVVETIQDFAERTNLLSLNAAIEAARAGSAGAGFSVIAAAIRELADKSAEAAKDVDRRLTAMKAGTAEALAAMVETGREIRTGLGLVTESLKDLRTIALAVETVAEHTSEIQMAAREQANATDDLVKRIHTFASIATETSAAAEEAARTVTATARMADDLARALNRFRLPGAV